MLGCDLLVASHLIVNWAMFIGNVCTFLTFLTACLCPVKKAEEKWWLGVGSKEPGPGANRTAQSGVCVLSPHKELPALPPVSGIPIICGEAAERTEIVALLWEPLQSCFAPGNADKSRGSGRSSRAQTFPLSPAPDLLSFAWRKDIFHKDIQSPWHRKPLPCESCSRHPVRAIIYPS